MYVPRHFAEADTTVLHDLMRAHPLATLVGHGGDGLDANHVPLLLVDEPAPLGALHGHVARANPLLHTLRDGAEVLVIFQGPAAYVSPSWYPAKAEHGRVVPTWNYAVVHAHARPRVVDEPAWVRRQIDALTRQQEARSARPWAVADAPDDFIDSLGKAIVGIELTVTRLTGKWKVSQNQPAAARQGVVDGLLRRAAAGDADMARLVAERD